MAEYDERLALFDLAERKGYDVTRVKYGTGQKHRLLLSSIGRPAMTLAEIWVI